MTRTGEATEFSLKLFTMNFKSLFLNRLSL